MLSETRTRLLRTYTSTIAASAAPSYRFAYRTAHCSLILRCLFNLASDKLRTMTQMTAAEETQDGYEDAGMAGGPGAPTPLAALEVARSFYSNVSYEEC
jgi:hypothetical protein